jgi:hypothetical protein
MKASGLLPCSTLSNFQPPPYVRFMTRISTYSGSDEIKISTVLHNTGQNGNQVIASTSPETFTIAGVSKTFSMCERRPQQLWFTEMYYDMKTVLGNNKTVTSENGVSAEVTGDGSFSFLQGTHNAYYLFHNGNQLSSGTRGLGYIDVRGDKSGISAALKYCWEAYPKRLDVFGDTLRINLFPRDIAPDTLYYKSYVGQYWTKNNPYRDRFDSCYHLRPGSWYRSDVLFKVHDGSGNPAHLSARHRNPIVPKYEDKYLHATQAIPGFYSDTMRHVYPQGSLEQRLFERKRIWSGIMYDYNMTEEPYNSGGRPRESIWEYWDLTPDQSWGDNNMGDLQWNDGYCNLHYDQTLGVLQSFLRTGHSKAWQVGEIMTYRRANQTQYHHENGHAYCDGISNYEKDEHGIGEISNRATHCWSEGMGLYYAITGDPFVGEAFRSTLDGAAWFAARAYQRDQRQLFVADGEIRYYSWPLLKLCSGIWYKYNPFYYDAMVHMLDKMIVPMEKRIGPGFVGETGLEWNQMIGYMVTPLIYAYHTLKPQDSVLGDTLAQMIYRIYQRAEEKVTQRGGINQPSEGFFLPSAYEGLNRLDNTGHTDDYAFVWRILGVNNARIQGLVNSMVNIGYHQRYGGGRDRTGVPVNDYSRALFRSNYFPGSETKLHGKIGLWGRMQMVYEYDSLCPVQPEDGLLEEVSVEKLAENTSSGLSIATVSPNPFNPFTVFGINIPAFFVGREIRLTIFDSRGRMIDKIAIVPNRSGIEHIVWKGYDPYGKLLSAGIYFARITSGKTAVKKTIKLILTK